MLGILGSIFSGGITGLLGSCISRYFDYKNKKLDREHELQMLKAESEIMKQEWAARSQIAKIEGESAIEVEDSKAFQASLSSEPSRYWNKESGFFGVVLICLDVLRGMIRPLLTIYLCILSTMIYLHIRSLLGIGINSFDLLPTLNHLIDTTLYLTTTVILWWFGSRQKSPPPVK